MKQLNKQILLSNRGLPTDSNKQTFDYVRQFNGSFTDDRTEKILCIN